MQAGLGRLQNLPISQLRFNPSKLMGGGWLDNLLKAGKLRAYSAGGGLGFGLNIVTTSGLHPGKGGGQQPEPHVQRFWFNPTLT